MIASRFVTVFGSAMHYYDQPYRIDESGKNDDQDGEQNVQQVTMLFVHGMPLHGYLWRHVMPRLAPLARCVAVDLIGMGQSGKPPVEYSIFDHVRYLQGFIQALNLHNIVLVLHGWGSAAGFAYASRHAEYIRGLVFYEPHIRAVLEWNDLSLPIQKLTGSGGQLSSGDHIDRMDTQSLLRHLMPQSMFRILDAKALRCYEEPFLSTNSRQPLRQFILEVPVSKLNSKVVKLIQTYSAWLEQSPVPKLMLYSMPGFTTTVGALCWAKQSLRNLTLGEVVGAPHFLPESQPIEFAAKIKDWYEEKVRVQSGVTQG